MTLGGRPRLRAGMLVSVIAGGVLLVNPALRTADPELAASADLLRDMRDVRSVIDGSARDPWGGPWNLDHVGSHASFVLSAGPDGVMDSYDGRYGWYRLDGDDVEVAFGPGDDLAHLVGWAREALLVLAALLAWALLAPGLRGPRSRPTEELARAAVFCAPASAAATWLCWPGPIQRSLARALPGSDALLVPPTAALAGWLVAVFAARVLLLRARRRPAARHHALGAVVTAPDASGPGSPRPRRSY